MDKNNIKFTFTKYVTLNIIGMMGLSCYILADTFFIANGIGESGLAALNLAIPIYSFINGVGLMIGMGGATRFTISKIKNVFTQCIFYGLVVGILFLVIGIAFSKQLASMLGADNITLVNTSVYLKTLMTFSPVFLLNNIILCFVRNDGNPQLSMIAMILGSFSNIALDYIFIFSLEMGMFGAAFATGIAPIVSLSILSIHFIKKKNTFVFLKTKFNFRLMLDVTFLGISYLINEVSSGIVIIVFNIIILKLAGNTAVAAYGIIANIALVVISIFTGISQGIQPLLSNSYGMQNNEDLKKVIKYGFATATTISIVVYIIMIIFADCIIGAFNKDFNIYLASIAKKGFYIYFIEFMFIDINILIATYFTSIDNPRNSFIISFSRAFAIIIPMVIILSKLLGLNGVWMSMPCSELIVCIISLNMLKNTN